MSDTRDIRSVSIRRKSTDRDLSCFADQASRETIMNPNDNVERAKAWYAALERGDIDAVINALAENVTWVFGSSVDNDMPWFGKFTGRTAVKEQFFGAIAEHVDNRVHEQRQFVASGGCVAVSFHIENTVKKNSNNYSDDGVHLWTFDGNGKVTSLVCYSDTAAAIRARARITPHFQQRGWSV